MDKIQLKKSNGEVFEADLIAHFESSGKEYVFYTLNETVDNGLVKMYVSEVGDDIAKLPATISDDEWANLKSVMKSIISGAKDLAVKYIKTDSNVILYIQNLVKTIALKGAEQLSKIRDRYDEWFNSLPLMQGENVTVVDPQPQMTAINPNDVNIADPINFKNDNVININDPVIPSEPVVPAEPVVAASPVENPVTNADVIGENMGMTDVSAPEQPVVDEPAEQSVEANQGDASSLASDFDKLLNEYEKFLVDQLSSVEVLRSKNENAKLYSNKETLFNEFGISNSAPQPEPTPVNSPLNNEPVVNAQANATLVNPASVQTPVQSEVSDNIFDIPTSQIK